MSSLCVVAGIAERTFLSAELMQDLERAARFDVPVLISAPSARDSEQIAAMIHRASARAERCFVKLSCASLASAALESALFGTGAAPGLLEQADGGTLYLGGVDAMGVEVQLRLHAFLESREVRGVRLISSSHRDLFDEVRCRRFHPELFYRLNVIHVVLHALDSTGSVAQ